MVYDVAKKVVFCEEYGVKYLIILIICQILWQIFFFGIHSIANLRAFCLIRSVVGL